MKQGHAALSSHRMHVVRTVRWSAQLEKPLFSLLRDRSIVWMCSLSIVSFGNFFKNLVNGVGCLRTIHVLELVHTMQIVVHFCVAAGQFARAVNTAWHWKLRSLCCCFMMHKFKPAEFHAICFREKNCPATELFCHI